MPIYKMNGTKNGKQKYRVRINYTDNFGKNRQIDRVAYGNAEAKELERQLEYEIKKQKPTARMTVRDLFDEYIKAIKSEIRETTYVSHKKVLETYIIELLGNVSLEKLTAPVLQNWKNQIEEMEVVKHNTSASKLAYRTKKNIYSVFRAMLNWGVKMDYMTQNNLSKVGNFKDTSIIKSEMDYYTAEEYKLFSSIAKNEAKKGGCVADWDYYVFFSIAFYTGLRKGEIHALKWSDINGNILSVSRSISQKLKGGDRETPPKNKSSIRTLQIPSPLALILAEHLNRYKTDKNFTEEYRICGGTRSLRDTSIENANIKFAKLAGIKKIRIHDFRHSHASVLVNEGINIQEIARRLGHANIEMTWNTYSHLYPREEERAVKILNKIV